MSAELDSISNAMVTGRNEYIKLKEQKQEFKEYLETNTAR